MNLPPHGLLAAAGSAALVVAATAVYGARRLARRVRLHAVRDAHPPLLPDDPTPSWLAEFVELSTFAYALPIATRDLLDDRYRWGATRRLRRLLRDALDIASHTPRLEWAYGDLARLEIHSPAAELAAAAILTRDLLDAHAFAALTSLWASAGLPLPGGDVCPCCTVVVEQRDNPDGVDGTDMQARWIALGDVEIIATGIGESAHQIAHGIGAQLRAAQRAPGLTWRVRVWMGEKDNLSELFHSPADAEYCPQPEPVR